jgi:hypothetical protein
MFTLVLKALACLSRMFRLRVKLLAPSFELEVPEE